MDGDALPFSADVVLPTGENSPYLDMDFLRGVALRGR